MVIQPGMGIAEPAIIQQKEFRAEGVGRGKQAGNPVKIEVKAGGLPIVQQDFPGFMPVAQPKVTCPTVQFAAHVAQTLVAPGPDHAGCGEELAGRQMIGGG